MKIRLSQLAKLEPEIVIIESVDLSLYIAFAQIDGDECLIADDSESVLKTRNLLEMRRAVGRVTQCEMRLRQRSAYDEMVGHRHSAAENALEISLGSEPLPDWLH